MFLLGASPQSGDRAFRGSASLRPKNPHRGGGCAPWLLRTPPIPCAFNFFKISLDKINNDYYY
jgi:hypothetical protein